MSDFYVYINIKDVSLLIFSDLNFTKILFNFYLFDLSAKMGKETGFNRRQQQYIVQQRKKVADRKRNDNRPKQTIAKPLAPVTDKKLRREEKKLAIKLAKKGVKRQKRDGMNVEEDGFEDVEEEMN